MASTHMLLSSSVATCLVMLCGSAGIAAEPVPGAVVPTVKFNISNSTEEGKVKCVDGTACCPEAQRVLEVVQKLVGAYAKGDLTTYEHYLDDKCTLMDEAHSQMKVGKTEVLAHLKESFAEHAPGGPKPLISLTIDQPYAKVHGQSCVVTFVATLQTGGEHPQTERANITDVFVKRDGEWKKSYWRGRWELVSEKEKS